MGEETKQKGRGTVVVVLGWACVAFSILSAIGQLSLPRDPIISNLLIDPPASTIPAAVGFIIGCNLFSIASLLLGIYVYEARDNNKGRWLMAASLILIFFVTVKMFMPSNPAVENTLATTQSTSFTASYDSCEFVVTFPHPVKMREASYGALKSHLVESKDIEEAPHLRAEFMPLSDAQTVVKNFEDMLKNYAHLAGIGTPEFTIGKHELGSKGTYSGVKQVGEYEVKYYGVVYVGDTSMITCMAVELLQDAPSIKTLVFLDSIARK